MKREKSVYSLDILYNTVCKDDQEIDFIDGVFRECLAFHQWHYQMAPDKQKRDVLASAEKSTKKTIQLLRDLGQYSLADDVEYFLIGGVWTKEDIISDVRKILKEKLLMNDSLKGAMKKNESLYANEEISKEKYNENYQALEEQIVLYTDFNITPSVYKNKYATILVEAFKEWCDEYPLEKAPDHFDYTFDPSIY